VRACAVGREDAAATRVRRSGWRLDRYRFHSRWPFQLHSPMAVLCRCARWTILDGANVL
jgi:hypothetical protein